jgi:hypothetical protein
MIRVKKLAFGTAFAGVVSALVTLLAAGPAAAGEADDLQAMIDRARNGVTDLERLDERGAAREDAALLRRWLEEAWGLRSEQKYDEVRIVLDRCDAQAEMIRQKILAAKVVAQAVEREENLKRLRDNIEKTRRAIQQATIQKAALEQRGK